MAEHLSDSDPQAPVRAEIAEFAQERIGWIESAVPKIGGEGATIDDVFPFPPEVRDEAPVPDWDERQEAVGRELGHKLGYANEQDVVSHLKGIDFGEGGKIWKMWAEVEAAAGETIVVSGSPHRPIGDDEKGFLVKRFTSRLGEGTTNEEREEKIANYRKNIEEYTEYDGAAEIAAEQVATEPFEDISTVQNPNRSVLPYGYEVSEGNPVVNEPTGQFIREGVNSKGQEIVLMRIDREDYFDEAEQKPKYRFQPDPMRRMGIISDIYTQQGDPDTPIVFVTSNAYASRQIDVIQAGLDNGRKYGITMYGRATLARIKDEPMLPGARLNQLPGDMRIMHENLQRLHAEVAS